MDVCSSWTKLGPTAEGLCGAILDTTVPVLLKASEEPNPRFDLKCWEDGTRNLCSLESEGRKWVFRSVDEAILCDTALLIEKAASEHLRTLLHNSDKPYEAEKWAQDPVDALHDELVEELRQKGTARFGNVSISAGHYMEHVNVLLGGRLPHTLVPKSAIEKSPWLSGFAEGRNGLWLDFRRVTRAGEDEPVHL